jgi:hypothetical protein
MFRIAKKEFLMPLILNAPTKMCPQQDWIQTLCNRIAMGPIPPQTGRISTKWTL